ncbi:hypothetical protein SNE40_011117 [Patella caerulea]|uniref:Uncharacterized protein n=1 Tax=Patella caerulea TaxID=87958 RepID=A0AAN8PSF4_PATCE
MESQQHENTDDQQGIPIMDDQDVQSERGDIEDHVNIEESINRESKLVVQEKEEDVNIKPSENRESKEAGLEKEKDVFEEIPSVNTESDAEGAYQIYHHRRQTRQQYQLTLFNKPASRIRLEEITKNSGNLSSGQAREKKNKRMLSTSAQDSSSKRTSSPTYVSPK